MSELKLNPAVINTKRSGIREFMKLAGQTPGCVSLTIGEPEFITPAPIRDAAKLALDCGRTHYIENNGDIELRRRIAQFEREHSGLDYTEDEVIVTVGATEGIFAALFTLLEPGDEVIVPTPAFGLYEAVTGLCRGKFVPLDTTGTNFMLTPKLLRSAITERTKAIILNSPNNPTGCVYDAASLEAVREAVQNTGIFVLCDEVYRQLVFSSGYQSFSAFPDMRERTVVINAFSKPYSMTGWRAGYLMADINIKREIEKVHQYTVVSSASFIQPACMEALSTDPSYMREAYRARRDTVCAKLEAMGLDFIWPEGAFYVFPSIKKFGMGSMEFCTRLLHESGLALTPGESFGANGHVRISFCCQGKVLDEGLFRLERFVRGL